MTQLNMLADRITIDSGRVNNDLIYQFNEDGTFETTKIDKNEDCSAFSGYWKVVETKDAQGKEQAAIELRTTDANSELPNISIMIAEVKKDYLISVFITDKAPSGTKVSNVWFNYYKRFPISAEDQSMYHNK